MAAAQPIEIYRLGLAEYQSVWQAMQRFTESRDATTPDQIWLLQHPPVFTQGRAGQAEHVLAPGDIPVIPVDRGGQVTYHGPGQLVAYLMIDMRRRGFGIKHLVHNTENAMIQSLAKYGIEAHARRDAPGVYLQSGAKIGQIGMRVRQSCTFHGLSLNVAMDLEPFSRINPCGYAGMAVTDMATEGVQTDWQTMGEQVSAALCELLDCAADRREGLPAAMLANPASASCA